MIYWFISDVIISLQTLLTVGMSNWCSLMEDLRWSKESLWEHLDGCPIIMQWCQHREMSQADPPISWMMYGKEEIAWTFIAIHEGIPSAIIICMPKTDSFDQWWWSFIVFPAQTALFPLHATINTIRAIGVLWSLGLGVHWVTDHEQGIWPFPVDGYLGSL